jgi:crotonobetainyl-CoA:carnitine CoA-transferase CaiB-like acyl-CoA transferase
VLGRPEWVERHPTAADRRAAAAELDAAIAAWTGARTANEAFLALQQAGVPAAPVLTNADIAADPHIAARGVLVEVEHPEIGTQTVMRAPWLMARTACEIRRHGPLLGQDNEDVLRELLGLEPGAVGALAEVLV